MVDGLILRFVFSKLSRIPLQQLHNRLVGPQAYDSRAGGGRSLGAELWGPGHWRRQRHDVRG